MYKSPPGASTNLSHQIRGCQPVKILQMKISLLQCCLLILMLHLTPTMADGPSHNGTIEHPSQELPEANEYAESNSSKLVIGNKHSEAEQMSSNLHKISRRGTGGRANGGRAVGGAVGGIAGRRHHRHRSNAPPPISILQRLVVDAILISLLIL